MSKTHFFRNRVFNVGVEKDFTANKKTSKNLTLIFLTITMSVNVITVIELNFIKLASVE